MIYTEDRETFERDIFRPPYTARLFDRANVYTARLTEDGRQALLHIALDNFWEMRDRIKVANHITRTWDLALRHATLSRPRWRAWDGAQLAWVWVKSSHLGRT